MVHIGFSSNDALSIRIRNFSIFALLGDDELGTHDIFQRTFFCSALFAVRGLSPELQLGFRIF
jgi:hypothetical protein